MSWSDFFRVLFAFAVVASLQAEPADFDLPVPVGMPVNGIKVPQYAEDGRRLLLFEAAVAKKVNEQRVEMETLKLEALDSEGQKIFVELPQAVFNLESRILTGENSAKISREDFEITGDSIEFNTKTRFGILRGNVKMVISTEGNLK
jgi:lipopolysaccharide assembly outer membrane protein LptD (OstA)